MESVNNNQEVDFIDIYPIDELSSTSIREEMQTLEEAVAYAEQHLDSSKELFILAIHVPRR